MSVEEMTEKRPVGRPRKVREEDDSEVESVPRGTVTMDEMMVFLNSMNAANREALVEAIREVRKPTEREQQKLDQEAQHALRQMLGRIEMAKNADAQRIAVQASCPHKRPNGVTQFIAAVQSDGYYRPYCNACGKQIGKIRATDQQKIEGIAMDKWTNVTVEGLERMAEASRVVVPMSGFVQGIADSEAMHTISRSV